PPQTYPLSLHDALPISGAGKTTVLVERYLHILRAQNVTVDNIVAITFTNRAANEMRERVRKEIDALLRASSGDERMRWLRHKRRSEEHTSELQSLAYLV